MEPSSERQVSGPTRKKRFLAGGIGCDPATGKWNFVVYQHEGDQELRDENILCHGRTEGYDTEAEAEQELNKVTKDIMAKLDEHGFNISEPHHGAPPSAN